MLIIAFSISIMKVIGRGTAAHRKRANAGFAAPKAYSVTLGTLVQEPITIFWGVPLSQRPPLAE